MDIENIDNLKPGNEPIEIYPHWPNVRCTNCGTEYTIELDDEKFEIAGACPNCKGVKFKTQINGSGE